MGREPLDIRLFNMGIISKLDSEDVPVNAATFSNNINPNSDGVLEGVPDAAQYTALGVGGTFNGWVNRNDGKLDLIYYRSAATTGVRVIQDFLGTPSESTLSALSVTSFSTINQSVYAGRSVYPTANQPLWFGVIEYGQFGGAAPSGYQTYDTAILASGGTGVGQFRALATATSTSSPSVASDYFQSGSYYYKYSLIYDGLQESPLTSELFQDIVVAGTSVPSFSVVVTAYGVASTNKRISGVNVYRASSDNTGFGGEPTELFRLVKSIDINDASWTTSGANKTFTFTDSGIEGITYDTNTGISETITDFNIKYELSTVHNGSLIVGVCDSDNISDGQFTLFKSKVGRFGTFDWTTDLIKLPEIPVAMASWGGRIYVFSKNTTYRIVGEGFYVEEELPGIGCDNSRSLVTTDYGLFWADDNNMYRIRGTEIEIIGEPVQNLYRSLITSPVVNYDSVLNVILFASSDITSNCFTFHLIRERWDLIQPFALAGQAPMTGLITDTAGVSYTLGAGGTYKNFSTTLNKGFDFITANMPLSEVGQYKKFYYWLVDYTQGTGSTVSLYYSINDGTNWVQLSTGGAQVTAGDEIKDTGQDWVESKKIKFRIIATKGTGSTNSLVRSCELIFRRFVGKRN